MDQRRKHAVLFAATLLCARKLMPMMEDNPDTSREFLTEHYRWRWGEFVRMLGYKCAWYGRKLMKISTFFPSSKLCGSCGQVLDSLPLGVRTWTCDCGTTHDRDLNAARNILAEGIRLAACGETVRPESNLRLVSVKQEPLGSCA